jgi:curved DNA-binding protein CbpA
MSVGNEQILFQTIKMSKSLYSLLQIPPTASISEIKKAYHKLALLHHPDKTFDATLKSEETFNSINEAYKTLSDPESRLIYDISRKSTQNLCIDTVLMDELTVNEDGTYAYDCRCGDSYRILKECVTLDNVLSCASCSLSICVEIET